MAKRRRFKRNLIFKDEENFQSSHENLCQTIKFSLRDTKRRKDISFSPYSISDLTKCAEQISPRIDNSFLRDDEVIKNEDISSTSDNEVEHDIESFSSEDNEQLSPILMPLVEHSDDDDDDDDDDALSIETEESNEKSPNFSTKSISSDSSVVSTSPDASITDTFSSPITRHSICSSPVTPTCEQEGQSKTVNWLKNFPGKFITPNKNYDEKPAFISSEKKRRKFVKGGYAERLEKLVRREQADYRIWKHQRSKSETNVDISEMLLLKVIKIHKEFSIYYVRCRACNFENDEINVENELEQFTVVLPLTVMVKLKLETGNIIEIYPPWRKLKGDHNEMFILHAIYMDVVNRRTEYFPCISECVFYPKRQLSESSGDSNQFRDVKNTVEVFKYWNSETLEETSNSVESIIQALKLNEFSLVARIRRIFHYYRDISKNKRWSVLIEDNHGFYSVIHLSESLTDDQLSLIKIGEGSTFHFEQLRVLRKKTKSRNPLLFSLIHSLQENSSANRSENYQQFCFVLEMTDERSFVRKFGKDLPHNLPLDVKSIKNILQDKRKEIRVSLIVKVIFRSREKLFVTDCSLENSQEYKHYISILISRNVVDCQNSKTNSLVLLRDVIKCSGCVLLDKFSRVYCFTCGEEDLNYFKSQINRREFELLENFFPRLEFFTPSCVREDLVVISGTIIKPSEEDSYSWSVCNHCGNQNLRQQKNSLFCDQCICVVTNPVTKMHMEVFLYCSCLSSTSRIKLKLRQTTIERILPRSFERDEYDVACVENLHIGPLNCYIDDIFPHHDESTVEMYILQEI